MRLAFATKAAAQAVADRLHAYMQATNSEYAKSVQQGRTTACCKPYQDVGRDGKPIGSDWFLNFKDRHMAGLTVAERADLKAVTPAVQAGSRS